MMRDFKDPEYKKWRYRVYSRDKFKCKKCGSRKRIQAHHIQRWEDYPTRRFDLKNGITLCFKCHGLMTRNEESWEGYCNMLLGRASDYIRVKRLIFEMKQDDEKI